MISSWLLVNLNVGSATHACEADIRWKGKKHALSKHTPPNARDPRLTWLEKRVLRLFIYPKHLIPVE
jgi:hypothetical protein